jgi:secreted trypsin-like serine protease
MNKRNKLIILFIFIMNSFVIGFQLNNGEITENRYFPFMVEIRNIQLNKLICSGALISSNLIITSAHCFDNIVDPQNIRLVLGKQSPSDTGFINNPIKIIIHEKYIKNDLNYYNDVALIYIQPLKPTNLIKYIQILNHHDCLNDYVFYFNLKKLFIVGIFQFYNFRLEHSKK